MAKPMRGASPERYVGTIRVSYGTPRQAAFNRLVLPSAGLVVVGMLVGGFVAVRGERPVTVKPAPAAAAVVAAPVVAAPVVAAPIVEPAPAATPALVDVRIDSNPRGATVTLVDRGRTQLLGTTPIITAVDPSREYDLVIASPDRPTRIEHLDANTTHKVKIDFFE